MASVRRIYLILAGLALVAVGFAGGAFAERWNIERWLSRDACSAFARSPFSGKFDITTIDGPWCYNLGPVQQISGVWYPGFETSEFVEDGGSVSPGNAWLELDQAAYGLLLERIGGDPETEATQVIRLTFEGARSAKPGNYGHMGMSPHVVVVYKVISARLLRGEEEARALEALRSRTRAARAPQG